MKIYKPMKNLTRSELNQICNRYKVCSHCVMRAVCSLTADPYELFQRYKRGSETDYWLERSVCLWKK